MKKISKNVLIFIVGFIVALSIGVYAATQIASSNVIYKNDITVESAINDLYDRSKNHCPDGKLCTEEISCVYNKTVETTKKCKRAETLHTEICNQNHAKYFCSGSGYKNQDLIIYGNCGIMGADLVSGDALDCDVTGNGNWERFYYVTNLNDTTAVLIYYNNVSGGIASNTLSHAYSETNDSQITAIRQLPTTEQWNNITLITTSIGGNSLNGYAARFIKKKEVIDACKIEDHFVIGHLSKCNYLLENSSFSTPGLVDSYWTETTITTGTSAAGTVFAGWATLNSNYANNSNNGVRPVIEVSVNDIEY